MCRAAPAAPRRGESTMSVSDVMTAPGLLARERTIAKPGFNRWLVPPAALAIHLCIGMAYGFSVFWLPLSKAIGINHSVACPAPTSTNAVVGWFEHLFSQLVATSCDWDL